MKHIDSVTGLQRRVKPFFDQLVRKRSFTVFWGGWRHEAASIPCEDYLQSQPMRKTGVVAGFDRVCERLNELNEDYPDEEIV